MGLLQEMEKSGGIQGLPAKDTGEVKTKSPEQAKLEYTLIKSLKTDRKTFDNINDKTAQDLVTQAHDRAEEIETIAFGMELDDGEIVKIFVNAEQSEQFEKALGDMLGQEDDVEVAIEKLSDDYDIVSVEWPEERGSDGLQNPETGQEVPGSEEGGEEDDEAEKEFALDFDLTNKTKDEEKDKDGEEKDEDKEGKDDEKEEEDTGKESDLDFDMEDDKDKEETSDEDVEDEEEKDEEEDNAEDGSDDEDGDNKPKKDKKKKKKSTKDKETIEMKESFLFADFLNKPILSEAKDKKEIFSKDELKIEDIFNTAFQQKIAKLLFLLDFPVDRILLKKSQFRKGVRNAALELNTNSRAKLLIGRLIKDLSVLMSKDEVYNKQRKLVSNFTSEDLKESPDIDEKMTNELQKLIIKIYRALGVPEVLLTNKVSQLKQDTRKTARAFASHTGIKSNLKKLARALDIDAPEEISEELLSEDVSNFSPDKFVNLVVLIATQLGIPEANLVYKKSMVVQSIKDKKPDLISAKNKLISIAKILSNQQIADTQMTTEEVNSAYMHRAADLGNWSIASKKDKMTLSIEDVSITLDGKDLELFKSSIDNGLSTLIKDGNEEWQFKAIDHGKKYIAINENSDKYMNGILLHEKDVNAILDIIDED